MLDSTSPVCAGRPLLDLVEGECAACWRGVNGTVSGGLLASGPGEVRLRCGENCTENPDDSANRAGLASEVDQDNADHAGYDRSVHQVLPRNRRGRPESSAEDDVDDNRRRDGAVLARLNSLVRR